MRPYSLVVAVIIAALPAGVVASGGGGGGMSSLPSGSSESYDPAEEYQKGVAALQAKDWGLAERSFSRVLQATPRDAAALYLAGVAKLGRGDFKRAKTMFEKSLKVDPLRLVAQRDLAITLAKLGETELAKAKLAELSARVTACGATCAEAAQLTEAVAAVQTALGTPAAALSLPATQFADAAAGDGAYLAAIALINERRYVEAIATLHAAQDALGPHPDVLTYLGYTHRKLGDVATARRYYEAALRIAPQHRGATEYYGELKVAAGDMAGARRMLARLDAVCAFGCAEAEELRRWVALGRAPS